MKIKPNNVDQPQLRYLVEGGRFYSTATARHYAISNFVDDADDRTKMISLVLDHSDYWWEDSCDE